MKLSKMYQFSPEDIRVKAARRMPTWCLTHLGCCMQACINLCVKSANLIIKNNDMGCVDIVIPDWRPALKNVPAWYTLPSRARIHCILHNNSFMTPEVVTVACSMLMCYSGLGASSSSKTCLRPYTSSSSGCLTSIGVTRRRFVSISGSAGALSGIVVAGPGVYLLHKSRSEITRKKALSKPAISTIMTICISAGFRCPVNTPPSEGADAAAAGEGDIRGDGEAEGLGDGEGLVPVPVSVSMLFVAILLCYSLKFHSALVTSLYSDPPGLG